MSPAEPNAVPIEAQNAAMPSQLDDSFKRAITNAAICSIGFAFS
jgi:hypothetical protein